jgi:heme exporter protein A
MYKDSNLAVSRWHVFRGERHVLRGLGFSLAAGRCLQLVGDNGAGKTTLLRSIAGLVPREEGELRWRDVPVDDFATLHAELAYLGHDPPLKADLSGRENVQFAVAVRGAESAATRGARVEACLQRVGARGFCDRPVRTLSAGQRRRIAFAALCAFEVPLWLMDEPATHLDVRGCDLLRQLIDEQLDAGGLVIAATHQDLGLAPHRLQRLALEEVRAP